MTATANNNTAPKAKKSAAKKTTPKKIELPGTHVATIGDYDIRTTDKGHIVINTKNGAASEPTSSKRVVYHLARQAKKLGDDGLKDVQGAIDHVKGAQGSGKKRNPVEAINKEIAKLQERQARLAENLKETEAKLTAAKEQQKEVKAAAKKEAAARKAALEKELADLEAK
jgi:hypothetical protein